MACKIEEVHYYDHVLVCDGCGFEVVLGKRSRPLGVDSLLKEAHSHGFSYEDPGYGFGNATSLCKSCQRERQKD